MRKLTLGAGFAAGYLLGAKAGTERYEQLVGRLRGLAGLPVVKEAADGLQQTATTLADRARDTVNETINTVNESLTPDSPVNLTGRTAASTGAARPASARMAGAAASQTAPDVP